MSNIPYIPLKEGSHVMLSRDVEGAWRANPQRPSPCSQVHTLVQGSIATITSVIQIDRNIHQSPGVVVPANTRALTVDDFSYRIHTNLTTVTCGHYEMVGTKLNVNHGGSGGTVPHHALRLESEDPDNMPKAHYFDINSLVFLVSPLKYWHRNMLVDLPAGSAVFIVSHPTTRSANAMQRVSPATSAPQPQNSYYGIKLAEWRTHPCLWKSYYDEPARFLTPAP